MQLPEELRGAREANSQAMDLVKGLNTNLAFEVILLARPGWAADNIGRAKMVGRLLHALWALRTELLELRPSLD